MKRLPQTHPCQFLMVASFPETMPNQSLSQCHKLDFFFFYCCPIFHPIEVIHRFQVWRGGLKWFSRSALKGCAGTNSSQWHGIPGKEEANIFPFHFILFPLLLKNALCHQRCLSAFSCARLESATYLSICCVLNPYSPVMY